MQVTPETLKNLKRRKTVNTPDGAPRGVVVPASPSTGPSAGTDSSSAHSDASTPGPRDLEADFGAVVVGGADDGEVAEPVATGGP